MNFSAVILAGGKSSRMGRDKAFLEFEGQTLLSRQIQIVREAGAKEIFISGRADTDYSEFGCPVLMDKFSDSGPLAGIERALFKASFPLVLVLAVDMPNLTAAFIQKLKSHCGNNTGAIPCVEKEIQPVIAVYPKTAQALAEENLGKRILAVRHFAEICLKRNYAGAIHFPFDAMEIFTNWNTQLDVKTDGSLNQLK